MDPVARLTIDGDVDSDGSIETGVFEITGGNEREGGLTIEHQTRTGYVVSGQGSSVNAFIGDLLGNKSNTKGVYTSPGGSQFTTTIEFSSWSGSGGQWGDTGNGGSKTDATGDGPLEQIHVLSYWLRNIAIDSLPSWASNVSAGPATLEVGEYTAESSTRYDPLPVVLETPTFRHGSQNPSSFSGTITCIEAADLSKAWDAAVRKVF